MSQQAEEQVNVANLENARFVQKYNPESAFLGFQQRIEMLKSHHGRTERVVDTVDIA
jgi:hypothetical protein